MTTTHKTLRGPRGGMIMTSEEFGKAIDKTVFPGIQGGPLMHVIAGKAVAFGEALDPSFKDYAASVIENAKTLAATMTEAGMPIISGGTDTHLMLVDVTPSGLSGRQAEKALDRVGITVNKNTIPGETRPPTQASGIRLGSPAVTTRGFGSSEMRQVGRMIVEVLQAPDDESVQARVSQEVADLTSRFSIPGVSTSTI
jgi:glycine hydroxymethyltransferase